MNRFIKLISLCTLATCICFTASGMEEKKSGSSDLFGGLFKLGQQIGGKILEKAPEVLGKLWGAAESQVAKTEEAQRIKTACTSYLTTTTSEELQSALGAAQAIIDEIDKKDESDITAITAIGEKLYKEYVTLIENTTQAVQDQVQGFESIKQDFETKEKEDLKGKIEVGLRFFDQFASTNDIVFKDFATKFLEPVTNILENILKDDVKTTALKDLQEKLNKQLDNFDAINNSPSSILKKQLQ